MLYSGGAKICLVRGSSHILLSARLGGGKVLDKAQNSLAVAFARVHCFHRSDTVGKNWELG